VEKCTSLAEYPVLAITLDTQALPEVYRADALLQQLKRGVIQWTGSHTSLSDVRGGISMREAPRQTLTPALQAGPGTATAALNEAGFLFVITRFLCYGCD
jgi:hypothetical protein